MVGDWRDNALGRYYFSECNFSITLFVSLGGFSEQVIYKLNGIYISIPVNNSICNENNDNDNGTAGC